MTLAPSPLRSTMAIGMAIGLLVLAALPGTRAAELELRAEGGRAAGVQAFRARVPQEALAGVEPWSLVARPSAADRANLLLVRVAPLGGDRSRLSPRRHQPVPSPELMKIEEDSQKAWQESMSLRQRVNAIEEMQKDTKTDRELAARLGRELKSLNDRQAAAEKRAQELGRRAQEERAKIHGKPPEPPSRVEGGPLDVTGLYRKAGRVRVDLAGAAAPGEEPRTVLTLLLNLPADSPEKLEVPQAWARAYAWSLARQALVPDAETEFHRYTLARLRKRFELRDDDLPDFVRALTGEDGRFRPAADIFSVTSGALAIEESLQLGVALRERNAGQEVPLADLAGPKIKSHPFEEMIRGRTPKLFPAASLVPEENWYAHFSTIRAQIRVSDLLDEWGTSFLQSLEVSSRDRKLKEKLLEQLAIDLSVLTRLFGDLVVGEIALTGSDPFLQDGSDVAVILHVKSRPAFEAQMGRCRADAQRKRPDAREEKGMYQGVAISSLATGDRRVSSYSCDLGEHRVFASSRKALERIIDAAAGRIPRLADAGDFRYLRTIFPGDAAAEDGYLHLSDRFIREVVGPRQKIGRLRQMSCLAALRTLQYAALESALEQGEAGQPTVEALVKSGLIELPPCPSGGTYRLEAGPVGLEAVCSAHNRLRLATPLIEMPVEKPTGGEARGYREFVENYERYWSAYFDPVGIRFRVSPHAEGGIEAETCILPLIESSIYNGVREAVGGAPATLLGARGSRAIASLSFKLAASVERLMRDWTGGGMGTDDFPADLNGLLAQVSGGVTLTLHDGDLLFTVAAEPLQDLMGNRLFRGDSLVLGAIISAITLPVSLTVEVKDPLEAARLLGRVLSMAQEANRAGSVAGSWRSRELGLEVASLAPYRGVPVSLASIRLFIVTFQLHHAFVGNRFVIATQRWVLVDAIDRFLEGKDAAPARGSPAAGFPLTGGGDVESANLLLEARPGRFDRSRPVVAAQWQDRMRRACFSNVPALEILLGGLGVDSARLDAECLRLFGGAPFCPSGGTYSIDALTGSAACSVHRTLSDPHQPWEASGKESFIRFLESLDRVRASFRFTDEGIRTRVLIERNAKQP